MDKLNNIHSRSILLYISFPCLAIFLTIICARFLHILLPFRLVGSIFILGPLVSAIMRVRFWKKRHEYLSEEILNTRQAKVIFSSIPAEILFWVIAMGFLLSEN